MPKDNELKFVTRQETFNDLAVRELAKGRSACICRVQFGRCSKSECASCAIHKQYERCYNELSDYDRHRLASYVSEYWQEDSLWPDKWKSPSGYVGYNIKWFFGILFAGLAALILATFCIAMAGSIGDAPLSRIDKCVEENCRTVRDFNHDGKINCVDYACGFKATWDRQNPGSEYMCTIVRNLNPAKGVHHLFVKVGMIDVEPWAEDPKKWSMSDNWDMNYYDPRYNIYGETDLWMHKCGLNN